MNRLRKKMQFHKLMLAIGCVAVMCLVFVAVLFGVTSLNKSDFAGLGGSMALPLFGMAAAGAMTDDEFRTKVLGGVEEVTNRVKKFEEFQTSTKTALGELENVTKTVNKQAETIAAVNKAIEAMKREQAIGTINSIQRFCSDPVRANYVIGAFKMARKMELSPAQKTAVTGVDSSVGAAVTPQETGKVVYDNLLRYGQFATLGIVPIGSRTQILPYISARPTAYIVAQGAQITEGAVAGSSTTATIKEFAAWLPVANALLEDASDNDMDLAMYLLDLIAQAIAYRLDWAAFAADGTDDTTDGAFTGIAVGGTAATAANGNTTVGALDLDDFVRCLTTVSAGVLQRQAKWWIHPTIIAKICLVKDANGRPIFQNAQEAPLGSIGSILGYPVIPTGAMPSTDSVGNVIAVFGDPRGCAVGIRKELNLASSSDFQFDYNRTAFRGVMRAGIQVQLATSFAKLTLAAQ